MNQAFSYPGGRSRVQVLLFLDHHVSKLSWKIFFLNSTELQEAFKADIMEFVTNHATVQTDLNVNPSLDIQHHDRNNVPAELPARLNLGSHKELCIWLSDEIWRSYKAKGGSKKRGQLIYGAEEFRAE